MNSLVCKLANGFHSFESSHIWNTREIYFKYSAEPYDTISMFVTNYSASLTFENIVSLKENLLVDSLTMYESKCVLILW